MNQPYLYRSPTQIDWVISAVRADEPFDIRGINRRLKYSYRTTLTRLLLGVG